MTGVCRPSFACDHCLPSLRATIASQVFVRPEFACDPSLRAPVAPQVCVRPLPPKFTCDHWQRKQCHSVDACCDMSHGHFCPSMLKVNGPRRSIDYSRVST